MIRCPVEIEELARKVRGLGGELYATGSYGYWLCGDHYQTPPIPEFVVIAPKHQHCTIEKIMPGTAKHEYIAGVHELALRDSSESARNLYPILNRDDSFTSVYTYRMHSGETVKVLVDGVPRDVVVPTRAGHAALDAAVRKAYPSGTKFALLDRYDGKTVIKEWTVPGKTVRITVNCVTRFVFVPYPHTYESIEKAVGALPGDCIYGDDVSPGVWYAGGKPAWIVNGTRVLLDTGTTVPQVIEAIVKEGLAKPGERFKYEVGGTTGYFQAPMPSMKRYTATIHGVQATAAKFESCATHADDLREDALAALESKWGMKDVPVNVITVVGDAS